MLTNLMFVYSLYVMLRFEIFNLLAFTLLELGLLPTWWYVDDGCNTESDDSPVDFAGSYHPDSFQAGVRCCSTDGSQCTTLGTCPGGTTYSDAAEKCADDGKRLSIHKMPTVYKFWSRSVALNTIMITFY